MKPAFAVFAILLSPLLHAGNTGATEDKISQSSLAAIFQNISFADFLKSLTPENLKGITAIKAMDLRELPALEESLPAITHIPSFIREVQILAGGEVSESYFCFRRVAHLGLQHVLARKHFESFYGEEACQNFTTLEIREHSRVGLQKILGKMGKVDELHVVKYLFDPEAPFSFPSVRGLVRDLEDIKVLRITGEVACEGASGDFVLTRELVEREEGVLGIRSVLSIDPVLLSNFSGKIVPPELSLFSVGCDEEEKFFFSGTKVSDRFGSEEGE